MDNWLFLLKAAVADDRDGCIEWSRKLGYLTGQENNVRVILDTWNSTLMLSLDHAERPRKLDVSPRHSVQGFITPAIRLRSRDKVG